MSCIANITGRGTPSFTWIIGKETHEPQLAQSSLESSNMFIHYYRLERADQHFPNVRCVASINGSMLSESIILSVTGIFIKNACVCSYNVIYVVPHISASISENDIPTLGKNYILTCNVSIPSTLMTHSVSYTWMEGISILTGQNTNQFNFSPLQLIHNGTNLICQYTVSSIYLNNSVLGSAKHQINIIGI